MSRDEIGGAPIRDLVARMWQTLDEIPGVGLAAPQIGDDRAVAVVEDKPEFLKTIPVEQLREQGRVVIPPYVLINPEIEPAGSETTFFFEGCLSVKEHAGVVERFRAVNVSWTDEKGTRHSRHVEGWHARILQHEVDHLRGILFVDRVHPKGRVPKGDLAKWRAASSEEIRRFIGL